MHLGIGSAARLSGLSAIGSGHFEVHPLRIRRLCIRCHTALGALSVGEVRNVLVHAKSPAVATFKRSPDVSLPPLLPEMN
jgi:hypothetical protein